MMQGKHQRSINTDFLGNKFILEVCGKCSIVYETMSIDTGPKICPSCANPEIDIDEIDLTKSYDENLRDLVKQVRKVNDSKKNN